MVPNMMTICLLPDELAALLQLSKIADTRADPDHCEHVGGERGRSHRCADFCEMNDPKTGSLRTTIPQRRQ